MRSVAICLNVFLLFLCLTSLAKRADAALTADQRKALADIRKDAGDAAAELRRDKIDEADKILTSAEARLQKLIEDQKIDVNDRFVQTVVKFVASQRENLDKEKLAGSKKRGKNEISFSKEIAPILNERCVSCHRANRSSGGLSLETFAGMKTGGQAGPLLVIGNPNASLIAQKLIATGNQRMPRGGQPLTATQIQLIVTWITQGAKFDGKDDATKLADLGKDDEKKPNEPTIVIAKPDGSETVSFSKDIAPFMANLCVGCHNPNRRSSGLSVATFEDLMRGGDSGRVVIPGNLEASRLWALVGLQDPIKMPRGQGLITTKNWNNLKTWLLEGAKYDGGDPTIPLGRLVPSEDEKTAEKLAQLTPEQFVEMREKQAEDMWKRVLPKARAAFVRSKEFYIIGNASQDRMQQIDDWAEDHAKSLRSLFGVKDEPIWKGRLIIFVFNDRFGYTEFNQVILNRQTDQQVAGHSVVTPTFSEAYVALQDVEDEVSTGSPGLQINLLDHLTGAFLQRSGRRLPEWVVRGTGIALAASKVGGANNPYLATLHEDAIEALKPLADSPNEIFVDGKFAPSEIASVGYTLVNFMLNAGTGAGRKYGQFIDRLQEGESVAAAVKNVYQADTNALATAYLQSLAESGRKGKK